MIKLIYVGVGGFIGACLRYVISIAIPKLLGGQFPYATLIVNVTGGLLIGFVMGICLSSNIISPNLKLFITAGLLGGLTTFSTFSYETINLLSNGNYWLGITNTFLNIILSFLAVILGKFISNIII